MQAGQKEVANYARSVGIKSPFQRRTVFLHTGHIGDVIAFLPCFKILGGTTLIIQDCPWITPPMTGYKYDSLKPLIESQGIEISMEFKYPVDYDMTNWRDCYRDDISLLDSQARFLKIIPPDGFFEVTEPWLKVDANNDGKGRVIFNRSPRYRNEKFPWGKVVNKYGSRALFVGTPDEYEDFCNLFGVVEYYKTESTLDVARLIEAADLFVGNQSSSYWIAAALRKPLIQETFAYSPNSMIKYPEAIYCMDGNLPDNY